MKATAEASQLRSNPVFWIMCALPAAAVVASLSTLAIALRGDGPLPAAYHWEGERLEADFARARIAATAGVELTFEWRPATHDCVATLIRAPADVRALELQITHHSDADLDRPLQLKRVDAGRYQGECAAIPAGRWRISVEDDARSWSVRGRVDGPIDRFTLRARNPDAAPP